MAAALVYLLPWAVSVFNEYSAKVGIFILNLLMEWIIALIWTAIKPQPL
jgi:hypothetical protein